MLGARKEDKDQIYISYYKSQLSCLSCGDINWKNPSNALTLSEFFIIKTWKTTTGKNIREAQGRGLPVSMTYNVPRSENESRSVMSDSLKPHGLYSPRNSPGQNIGVGSLSCLQGVFPTQGSNPGLPYCRQILYQLSHKGSPLCAKHCANSFKCITSFMFVTTQEPTVTTQEQRLSKGQLEQSTVLKNNDNARY